MKKIGILVLLISMLSLYLKAAEPKDKYWYVGGGFGFLTDKPTQDYTKIDGSYDYDVDYSLNIFGGYNFTKWFALEGEANYGLPNKYTDSFDTKIDNSFYSLYVNTVFKYTFLNHHTPFVKLGLGYANYRDKYTSSLNGYSEAEHRYNYGYHLDVGYEYTINNNNAVSLSYDFYKTFENDEMKDSTGTSPSADYTMDHSEIKLQYKYSFR